jgi:class 3 adenylate cyclase
MRTFYKATFVAILFVISGITILAASNIIRWTRSPDFGFGFRSATGIKVVGILREHGREAGLKVGDRIISVNNKTYKTYREFNSAKNWGPNDQNTYLIERDDRQFNITITSIPYGFKRTFSESGLPFLVGLCYMLIGTVVFLMKPYQKTSWVFFISTVNFGILAIFLFKVSTLKPFWLDNFIIFAYCFFPSTMIHLASNFPEERRIFGTPFFARLLPYAVSAILFICIRSATPNLMNAPKTYSIVLALYMVFGVLFFLGSNVQLRFWSKSEMVKRRATMVLLGFAIAALLPVMDFAFNATFRIYLVPGFNFYLPFFIAFPSFVGYSIVKHDLFDIDAIIKRTYGYVLTTGTIAGIYGLVVLISNLAFGEFEFARSPSFPLIFILTVVFLFNPIRNRVQKLIDRVFYRLEYDYQETVRKISETMRSLLNQDAICRGIMKFALEPMFVDSGSVMILSKDKSEYECFIQTDESQEPERDTGVGIEATLTAKSAAGEVVSKETAVVETAPENTNLILSTDDPMMRKLAELKKEVTRYDIQEDPFFEDEREACEQAFERLGATLMVPLIYEERLTGVISLGQKKSGKFYRREDINLLNTLAGQGALAVENARMVEEIVEEERMRTRILDAFGKYVTPEVRDQILEGNIPLDGEAKEVTVLFADLRDFTTLSESTTPREVVRIINGYFREMADAIGQNQGLVLQFIGDEIEAVFGAPMPLEDHPTHAVRAALAMQDRLVVVNEKLAQQGYGPLRHGIGVHTGTVVAANIGSEDRLSYAMVGDTVNLASRIQGLNKKFGTDLLISSTTVEKLVDDIAVEKLPATTVKGKRNPVEVYKLARRP